MQEIIHCPSCQRKLQVPESLLGQDVQCPTCGATFVASWGGQEQVPPAFASRGHDYFPPEPPPSAPSRQQHYRNDDYDDYDDRDDHGYGDYDDRTPRYRRRRDLLPHRGGVILTLGILALLIPMIGLILGIMAWVMGHQDMNEIKAGRMDPEGESSTNAGRICGIIATILYLIILAPCFICFPAALFGRM